MDTIESIEKRRSIRSFVNKEIPEDILKKILECGLRAPSSKNSNPWFFVVVKGKEKDQVASWILEEAKLSGVPNQPVNAKTGKIAEGSFDSTEESVKAIKEAPILVLVFNRAPMSGGNKIVMNCNDNGRSLYTYACEILGIGSAVENVLLAANSFGLASVYMADSYPARKAIEKALKIDAELLGSISIGYPAYEAKPREIHKNLVVSWSDVLKNGMPRNNFTAKKFEK